MKQKLQRLKGGRLGSQLFLKTFMLLAFMLSGIGSAWADTYVFDMNTQREYNGTTTTFTFGEKVITLECNRTDGKAQQDANDPIQKGLKYSAGKEYKFTFPTGEIVKKIIFTGFSRDDANVSYINKINGNVRDDGNNVEGTTQFPHRQTASDDDENVTNVTGTYEVNFYSTLQNTVSFETAGKETNLIITVVTEKQSDEMFTVNFSVPETFGANVPTGTLKAVNVKTGAEIASGSQVKHGTEVKFIAWDYCGNEAQGNVGAGRLILNGWKVNGGELLKDNIPLGGIAWWHKEISYTLKVTENVNFEAIYGLDYFIHYDAATGGSVSAKIGNDVLNSNSSGFRGNSTIVATATPAYGYLFDHWEGYLADAGDTHVWDNANWSTENPFTFVADGSTFNNAWGYDIHIKPVFTPEHVRGVKVGPDARNLGWNSGNTDAFSNEFTLESMHEWTFKFRNKSRLTNEWNNWVIGAYKDGDLPRLDNENTLFIVRPDQYVFDSFDKNKDNKHVGHANPTVALVGGALDYEQYKRDLDGADVTVKVSFDGNTIFVYEVIENNGRTYTYYYPSQAADGLASLKLRVGVDQSQLINFESNYNQAYRVTSKTLLGETENTAVGHVTILNEQDTQILEGSVVGAGTLMRAIATAADGYVFDTWGFGLNEYVRPIVAGKNDWGGDFDQSSYEFKARFKNVTDFNTTWTLKTEAGSGNGNVYYSDGSKWRMETEGNSSGVFHSDNIPNEFDGAYKDANGTPMPGMDGLLFNKNIRIAKNGGAEVLIKPGGIVKIPVTKGEIVTFNLWNDGGTRSSEVKNADGTSITVGTGKTAKDVSVVANADGYIEIHPIVTNATNLRMSYIRKNAVRDFIFQDGNTVAAQPGSDDYINTPVAADPSMANIIKDATFEWTSSNPADVQVDRNTGRIVVNESFNGEVKITAIMQAVKASDGSVLLPAVAKQYTLMTSENKMYFENNTPEENLKDGSVVYWQSVSWTDPENIPEADVKYRVVSTSAQSAKITYDDGDNATGLTVIGSGYTVVKANCGAISATYTLHTHGLSFSNYAVVYDFSGNGTYTQTIDEGTATYSIEANDKFGAIKNANVTINPNTGTISGLPAYAENKGGAIVVTATSGGKSVKYVLTIPYKKYTWNFYDEQVTGDISSIQTINSNKHFTVGDLAPANPGAASQVSGADDVEIPNDGSGVFPKQYLNRYDDEGFKTSIRKQLRWQNAQNSTLANDDPHKYWNYTFKTLRHVNHLSKNPIDYCNEPLFSYKGAVNGNNVRIVNETQGLIFNCAANAFGINDNNAYTATANNSNAVSTREQDRAILLYKDNSFTIPFVQKDHYVKIHWYRHSTNAGDMFSVTNAKDLDGTIINPKHRLRFTGSHYESNSEYRGLTILQAAADGPMTITNTAPTSWIEIYTIELTDEYSTELRVEYAHVQQKNNTDPWGGPMNSGYNNNWMFNMHDNIVSVVRKVGDAANNHQYTEAEISYTDWASLEDYRKRNDENPPKMVTNCANIPTQRVGENPIIYIGSFPGYTNGWNGWSLDVEAFPVPEDALNLKIGLQKELVTRIGNNITYGVHALTNFEGTGTAHVIVRTKSGGVDGNPRYTLDQQEAYFPVGEYHPQEYPYTWDFTNYNMNDLSVADKNTYDMTRTSIKESYGGWKPGNGARKMFTIANNEIHDPATRGVAATVPQSLAGASNSRRYNKFLFADGSQFTVNQGYGASEIRETDGLRMTIGADMSSYQDRAVTLYENGSGIDLGVEGATITVPEVDQNYYIFVRSANKPKSVVGAEDLNETEKIESTSISYSTFDNNVEVAFKQGDIPANVWIYKQSANAEKTDVVITPNGPVEGIGVTNYMKPMVQFKNMARATYTTDARAERIDYHNTGFFTNHDLKAYVANQNARMGSNDANSKDSENGTITLTEIKVIPEQGKPLDGSRGLMLEDVVAAPKAGAVNTARPLLPLFVPACNLQDESLVNNKFVGCITETTIPASTSTTRTYTLTNQYYDWDWANKTNVANPEHHVASDAAFYINRSNITSRKNSAYLSVSVPQQAGVKQIYMIFGEDDMEDATAIDGLEIATSEDVISQPVDVYTLTGVKLNGMPTQKGVYVINGKKVFVK